jgi:ribosomal protein L11 methyltransferase
MPGGSLRIRGFLNWEAEKRAGLVRLKKRVEHLFSFFPEAAAPFWEIRLLPSENWQENWKRNFKPLRVCSQIVVCPSWETFQPGPRDKVLYLDPGQAFGTGGHASTQLCLRVMEELQDNREAFEQPFKRVLDVGTGTGILALAAALFEAQSVLAIDLDPLAVESAERHVRENKLSAIIRVEAGGPESVSGTFSLVVANLTRDDLLALDSRLADLLETGGFLILSGVLNLQAKEVIRAYSRQGLRLIRLYLEEEWAGILLKRDDR